MNPSKITAKALHLLKNRDPISTAQIKLPTGECLIDNALRTKNTDILRALFEATMHNGHKQLDLTRYMPDSAFVNRDSIRFLYTQVGVPGWIFIVDAIERNSRTTLEYLATLGMDFNVTNQYGIPMLTIASCMRTLDGTSYKPTHAAFDFLLSRGDVNVHVVPSPLHLSPDKYCWDAMINRGVSVNIKDADPGVMGLCDMSPLDYIRKFGERGPGHATFLLQAHTHSRPQSENK
jgi:hypothetical protein